MKKNDIDLSSSFQSIESDNSQASGEPFDIAKLWIYRILVKCEKYKVFINKNDFASDAIANFIGLDEFTDASSPKEFCVTEIKKKLFELANQAESCKEQYRYQNDVVQKNLDSLANMLSLNEVDLGIIKLTFELNNTPLFDQVSGLFARVTLKDAFQLYANCLDCTENEVKEALYFNSNLLRSGLIVVDKDQTFSLEHLIQIMNGLCEHLSVPHEEPEHIFKSIVCLSSEPKLQKKDYPQISKEIDLLMSYIEKVKQARSAGVNILLYGLPGVGKTEFARMIAKECNLQLFEVANSDEEAKPLRKRDRLNAYKLAQSMFRTKTNAAILFDEVEDVFSDSVADSSSRDNTSGIKCWINQTLETNHTPSFWVTNNIDNIDAAYIRRFDFVIELKVPPREVREIIINHYLSDLPVRREWINMISENDTLSPAMIERSAKVVKTSSLYSDPLQNETALETLLQNTNQAMGYSPLRIKPATSTDKYRTDVLNTDLPIEHICAGLDEFRQARICLYGPPGSGKTAFGQYISTYLDMPLISKKASDIVSPFLGVSEKNMAKMFRQAKNENAILMLDEADTFLRDRKGAHHSWEISAVNEMLTQMESFEGIFIASTNFMDSFDSASMRRFDIKLKFDYMQTPQVITMFKSVADSYGLEVDQNTEKTLSALNYLTLGDFAVLNRKLKFIRTKSTDTLLEILKQECAFKHGAISKKIGF